VVLESLAIYGGADAADRAAREHVAIESIKLAVADAAAHVGDPRVAPDPTASLLDPRYVALRRAAISDDRAIDAAAGRPTDTVYVAVATRDGGSCSFIQSVYEGFGSGLAVPGLGFTLQNRGAGFTLEDGHPNCAAPGKRVWTSPISFLASANCARYCGAEVDFVDIDPATRNMSPAALAAKLEQAQRDRCLPDIVIPVHFGGLPCDMQALRALADRYRFRLLEDASHAVGAHWQGVPIGSRFADASVFSFHPVKIITTAEGGMVTTQDAALAEELRLLRSHGMVRDPQDSRGWYYEQRLLGFN